MIDGQRRVDSPALRIFNEDNGIVTLASVDVRNVVIYYVENEIREIVRIWILTPEEVRQGMPKKNWFISIHYFVFIVYTYRLK